MGDGIDTRDGIADVDETPSVSSVAPATSGVAASTDEARQTPEAPRPQVMRYIRQRLPRIMPWVMTTIALIIVGMLALLLADTRTTDAAVRPTPTATAAPTVTAAPTATPIPIDGFQFYRDPANHFIIQYPLGWYVSSDNTSQGIEFCDDCNNPGYIVQVNTPSNLGDIGPPPSENTAAGWVKYALNGLASHLQSGTLTPSGAQQPIVIGGVVWQSGSGLVTDSSGGVSFRVQVYATVYEAKPYILVLSTTEDRFTAGTIQFFGPMLQSFQFVKPTP